ncbi:uncharacterized protein LOC111005830 [Momordica charantia]|uniref:Uncharacterized protein LOC111005830 n=1 Tax=Momordica charantia TaxID=3673 RepID=A0A6J1BV70_MOMCH|nr:uncharacterized protein LOC111005830 [Momordica charantia]
MAANFIHYFPTTILPTPNSNCRYYLHPPPPQRRGSVPVRVKCNGDAKTSAPQPETGEGKANNTPLPLPLPTFQKLFNNSNPFFRILPARLLMSVYASRLVNSLKNSLVFSVQPTTDGGSNVGVKWKLGWEKIVVTLGKGINVTSQNSFGGKLLLGNLETIMDPLVQLMPNLMNSNLAAEEKLKKIAISLCVGFFLLVLSLFFFQFSVR